MSPVRSIPGRCTTPPTDPRTAPVPTARPNTRQTSRRSTRTTAISAAASALLAAACVRPALAQPSQSDWASLARNASRASLGSLTLDPISPTPRLSVGQTTSGQPIQFVGQAGVVVFAGHAFAIGAVNAPVNPEHRLVAIHAETGQIAWLGPIAAPVLDSWATPAADAVNRTVLVASGQELRAFHADTGQIAWTCPLANQIVNSSPVLTSDRPRRNRAFISGYPTGGPSYLFCVNVDPFVEGLNPYQPGEIVWQADIGFCVGGTPAYDAGVVYAAVAFGATSFVGEIHAFDADQPASPAPRYVFVNPSGQNFYGGVSLRRDASGTSLFAATYAFAGGVLAAELIKLDALTGIQQWSAPCNRTSSIPVPLPDGRILLSAGIQGYGTVPSVQLFSDHPTHATLLWDTALDTWNDANNNNSIDPGEFLRVGGWTQIPAIAPGAGGVIAAVGAIPSSLEDFGPCDHLDLLDLSKNPSQSGFIVSSAAGGGATPALSGKGVYTVGGAGLIAFGPAPPRFDVNQDARVGIGDLVAWEQSSGLRDVDRDGAITPTDLSLLRVELRYSEPLDLLAGRR